MKMDPLSPKEVSEAADLFFEAYNIVDSRMPQGSSVEDTIKIMEQVNKIASKLRSEKEKEERDARLGFCNGF
jgi:3-methyladenine DNA glycosylase AlkC